VTGASSGIGAALSHRLARRGYEVWIAARRAEALEAEVKAIGAEGGRAHALILDVSDPESAERRIAALDEELGGIDLVVANAGIGGRAAPVARQTFADFRMLQETNLLGAAATILALVPKMVERGRGHIVGISSLAAEVPLPAGADYGTSKAALTFFLECCAADLIPRGIDVTIVHPGFVRTPLTDKNKFQMPFLVELDAAAKIIDRAIEKKQRFCRFPFALTAATTTAGILPRALRDAIIARNAPKT
jgi:short-subunit dehydrogenase